ncbi:MAG: GNAT family N-acetyltransferase [Deltaproteobacteria bacterium]|nr:GNAT family N-acetyltransferase [Deltaproteobacteria bacterium]
MREMPVLETERLIVRPLSVADTAAVHELLQSIGWVDRSLSAAEQRAVSEQYVGWSSLNHRELARLNQPPYGDRAVVLRETGRVIGLCGLVPYVDSFGVFPYFGGMPDGPTRAEVGIMWAIAPSYQRKGHATEVARALIAYAFDSLGLARVVATTERDNAASQRVMEKAGMRLESNPFAEPPWLQVFGVASRDAAGSARAHAVRAAPELDHINVYVTDVARCREFYLQVLGHAGYRLVRDFGDVAAGLGTANHATLALVRTEVSLLPSHLAFRVPSRETVDALYRAARSAGARDNGAPGLRPQYHQSYYAAFVLDPEGNNLGSSGNRVGRFHQVWSS